MSGIRRFRGVIPSLIAVVGIATIGGAVPAQAAVGPLVEVLVQKAGGNSAPETAVKAAGGKITYELPIINGFAAEVPQKSLGALQASDGVSYVTEDRKVEFQSDPTADAPYVEPEATVAPEIALEAQIDPSATLALKAAPEAALATSTGRSVATNEEVIAPQPDSVFLQETNIVDVHAQGVTGSGSVVALVDTGVSSVDDLKDNIVKVADRRGNLKNCVNLSGERSCEDSYGHGTFIAGLIAGDGTASDGKHIGSAPDAGILSIKIAGADGSAPVGKILYAIQWVTDNKDKYGIDALNLSLGTDSTNSYQHDPLNLAVERAWQAGVTVVVSAGNRGPGDGTISKPADDPLVITVGAVDDLGTADTSDDVLPDFSSRGPTVADGLTKPDVVAPGAHLVSLRAPGSEVEKNFPGGVDETYRRGSGTSMATGVVSGAIALLKEEHPEWNPNQVKWALRNTARTTASGDKFDVGKGLVDIAAANNVPTAWESNTNVKLSDGRDPIWKSQGNSKVVDSAGQIVGGVVDAISGTTDADPSGGSWYSTKWKDGKGNGNLKWNGGSRWGQPAGGSWYGGSWYGGSWYGGSWYGGSWYGGSWYGGSWYGGSWYGGSWYGGSWYGAWG